jgi:hypothetical protein
MARFGAVIAEAIAPYFCDPLHFLREQALSRAQ